MKHSDTQTTIQVRTVDGSLLPPLDTAKCQGVPCQAVLRHMIVFGCWLMAQAAMDALRVGALAACRLRDADAAAGLRHIALAGLAMLPQLLQPAAAGPSTDAEGTAGAAAVGNAAVSDGSVLPVMAAAAAAAAQAQWRPSSLAWLEGAQLQAGMQYGAAAAAYHTALQSEHLDAETAGFVAARLTECCITTGDWPAPQRQLDDTEQVSGCELTLHGD